MQSKTKTEITIHTRQTTLVRGLKVRCQQCGAEVSIVTPEHPSEALHTTPHEIDRPINQGALHPIAEAATGKLICANSIADDSDTPTASRLDG